MTVQGQLLSHKLITYRQAVISTGGHIVEPSVLQRCWLGGRKSIRPVKTDWWGTDVVICLERGANDLHMVQLMPLPPHHLLRQ